MFRAHYFVACFLGLFVLESKASIASFIKPCKLDDEACMVSSAQAAVRPIAYGIPELGVPPSEPLHIDLVRSDDTNLKLGFRNVDVVGISKANITSVSVKENTIKFVMETPLRGTGQYDLNGKIFIIEAWGNDTFKIETDNAIVYIEAKYKTIEKNNKKYWKITGFGYKYDLVEKAYINLYNLFGGDEKRAKPFDELLDQSWQEIVYKIGGPLLKDVVAKYVNNLKKFLLAVPIDELQIV